MHWKNVCDLLNSQKKIFSGIAFVFILCALRNSAVINLFFMKQLTILSLFFAAIVLHAESHTPDAQQALAKELTAKVQRSEIWKDDDGNVTGLVFINHQALTKETGEKPGINDSDLANLAKFPKLEAVNFEAQPIGDEGLAMLINMPGLKQIGFHYMAKHPDATATPDCVEVINGKSDLEILEIKHNFRMKSFAIEKITTSMPKVWRLVLDTPVTAEQTLHLGKLCPNVRDLQLHRTKISGRQLAELAKAMPNLEVLWLKPKGDLTAEHLAALKGFSKLRIFSPQSFKNQLPWEKGWDALLELPALERVELFSQGDNNGDSFKRLLEAKPSLKIDGKLTRSRNYEGL